MWAHIIPGCHIKCPKIMRFMAIGKDKKVKIPFIDVREGGRILLKNLTVAGRVVSCSVPRPRMALTCPKLGC